MRTTTAAELAVLAGLNRQITWRVKIANGSGTMIDLSSWVEGISIDQDVDQPVSGATVRFTRANGATQSLSPLRTDSTLNRLDDGVTYAPQIDLGRAITIELATTAVGASIQNGDFKLRFKGTTDVINLERSPIEVDCRDLGAQIVDRWVETPKSYGSGPGVAVETVMQQILDDNFGAGVVPLYTPVSPSYVISPAYQQQVQSIMDAELALAQNPGWDARYKWDDGTSQFRFTLYQPPRTKTTPDYTFGPSAYFDVTTLSLAITDVRNVIIVSYFNTATQKRETITVSDATSITKYGRRPLIITEGDTSPITTGAAATTLGNSALSDLKEPKAEQEIELPFFWPGDLGDLYRFSPNGVHYNSNQDWAVVSIVDDLSPGKHRTRIRVRGTPIGQYIKWRSRGKTVGGVIPAGDAVPPQPYITPLNSEVDDVTWNVKFDAILGSGGGGTNLTYVITAKKVYGAMTTLSTGNASAFPLTLAVDRDLRYGTALDFAVTDAATGLTAHATWTVPSSRPEINSTGNLLRARAWSDGIYALKATENDGTTKTSTALAPQGSVIPGTTAKNVFSYNSGGPATTQMWIAWSWSAFTLFRSDGTTISVPSSASLGSLGAPTLSQVAGGALGARTRFARIAYVKSGMAYRFSAESSFAISANNLLKVTSPAADANYDGWEVWVGSSASGEFEQVGTIAFGTDWTEPVGGFSSTTTPYNTLMQSAIVSTGYSPLNTFYFYPWWDLVAGLVVMLAAGLSQGTTGADAQNRDGRIALSPFTAMSAATPAGGSPGNGISGGGKYL